MRLIGFEMELAKTNPTIVAIIANMNETEPSNAFRIMMLSLKSEDGASIAIAQFAPAIGVYAM